jgi:hypothetical protein
VLCTFSTFSIVTNVERISPYGSVVKPLTSRARVVIIEALAQALVEAYNETDQLNSVPDGSGVEESKSAESGSNQQAAQFGSA